MLRNWWLLLLAACGRLEFTPVATDRDLIAHYLMDDMPADGVVADISGYGNDAVCAATECPTPVAGVRDGALKFDGIDDALVVSSTKFDTLTAYTVAFWMRRLDTDIACAVSKTAGDADGNTFQICVNPSQVVRFFNWNGSSNDGTDGVTDLDNGWHHFALGWSGNGPRESFYFDGALRIAVSVSNKVFDDGPVHIGTDIDSGMHLGWLEGGLDDIRIYNRELSEAEIAALAAP